ncbi:GLPGLI family protein [Chryseobacterium sp.]|uniref:GLPGLI family protein n=1 Tax=Chryseobacterium sp. TaxID=1871047 RepID=UPI00289EDA02|nr:GLPGLI family protein [Chryseobacterium sp.]
MRKFIILFFIFLSLFIFSQNSFQAIYSLDYKTDSLKKNFKKEFFYLDFNKEESIFKSKKVYDLDSLSFIGRATLANALSGYTLFREVIKNNNKQLNVIYKNNGSFNFIQEPAVWSIENEFDNINGINCRIATTTFLGRRWKACYAEEYPFSFGPYMFSNLPGLIISIKDYSNSYIFQLQSIKKHQFFDYNNGQNVKIVSKKDFYKILIDAIFGLSILQKVNFDDPILETKMRKNTEDLKKKSNNFPIDLEMNYLLK